MPYYKNTYYKSKASAIRAIYDAGDMTTTSEDKNRVAKMFGMKVQTVHATLVKYVGKSTKAKKVTKAKKRVAPRILSNGNETITAINNAYDNCYQIAESKGYDVSKIDIKYDLKGTTAGMFCYGFLGGTYFRVNLDIAKNNLEEYLKKTVPHEFCHYLVRTANKNNIYYSKPKPHGNAWKAFMINVFNLKPLRCHNYDMSNVKTRGGKKFKYVCDCNVGTDSFHLLSALKHKRVNEGEKYICKKCKSVVRLAE